MSLNAILDVLADGEFHSGAELGDALGVSRTAVWKHLQKLEPLGLELTSVKGKGYCLKGGLELLDALRIKSEMDSGARSLLKELDVREVIGSTNDEALSRAKATGASGYVCMAEQQSAGKGRRGRQWVSPFGKNIYLSAVWEFDGGVAALEGLSLAVGVAIVRALESVGAAGLELKWPNDVLWRQRKLAGVLLEMTGDVAGRCQVVVGLGLNVSMPKGAAEAIDQAWVDVAEVMAAGSSPEPVSRNQLASAILSELLPLLQNYSAVGFQLYRDAWQALDACAGKSVELQIGSELVGGTASGVTDTGALVLESGGELQSFNGGEISLRALSDE